MFYSPIHRACNVDLDVADGYFYMGSQVAQPFWKKRSTTPSRNSSSLSCMRFHRSAGLPDLRKETKNKQLQTLPQVCAPRQPRPLPEL